MNIQTLEGYRAFRMITNNKTGNNTIHFDVKADTGTTLFSLTADQKVVDKIHYSITPLQPTVVVG